MIAVRPLRDRREIGRAWRVLLPAVYAGVPGWHDPPLPFHLARLDPAQEPIWREAERLLLLAERDGRPAGRLLAFVPPGTPPGGAGRFALFDALDDRAVVDALFGEAERWLRGRGCRAVEGPLAFSIHDEVGLLVDGFDRPPAFLMPFNPPHAEGHLRRLGFVPIRTFHSAAWELSRDGVPVRADRKDLRPPPELALRGFDLRRREADTAALLEVYNAAFRGSFGFEPLPAEGARLLVDQFVRFGDPRLVRVAARAGRVVGFALVVPDPNVHLHRTRGQPDLLRLVRLAVAARLGWLRHARFITLAVLPDERRQGVAHALVRDAAATARGLGYRSAELSYVDDGNDAMNGILAGLSLPSTKRYALYRREL
ncbi:MAG TPA: GNAT family N-acetyltransferase [Anaeromyxobacter sp.]|nr:GNAT family N-acetyltransferase [Anaeromyxobacter sp.]